MDGSDTDDPTRGMSLLWRAGSSQRRTAGSSPDVDAIVAAAVAVADSEGLAAVSMRRVAAELDVPTMTLYGRVPGKGELVDAMLDAVQGELHPDETAVSQGAWRQRLGTVARAHRDLYLRHPWALHPARPTPPGPGFARRYELELRAVDGFGLSEAQMDLVVTLLEGFVRGTVGSGHEAPARWERFVDADRFPTVARVHAAARTEVDDTLSPARSFEFGLERLLDGIGILILDSSR